MRSGTRSGTAHRAVPDLLPPSFGGLIAPEWGPTRSYVDRVSVRFADVVFFVPFEWSVTDTVNG